MKTTRYFDEQVVRRRPYVTVQLCAEALLAPIRREMQADGRIRLWGRVVLPSEDDPRILRVVLLDDGVTVHNAFLDRSFREMP